MSDVSSSAGQIYQHVIPMELLGCMSTTKCSGAGNNLINQLSQCETRLNHLMELLSAHFFSKAIKFLKNK